MPSRVSTTRRGAVGVNRDPAVAMPEPSIEGGTRLPHDAPDGAGTVVTGVVVTGTVVTGTVVTGTVVVGSGGEESTPPGIDSGLMENQFDFMPTARRNASPVRVTEPAVPDTVMASTRPPQSPSPERFATVMPVKVPILGHALVTAV